MQCNKIIVHCNEIMKNADQKNNDFYIGLDISAEFLFNTGMKYAVCMQKKNLL